MIFFKKKSFNFRVGTTSYIIPYKKDNIVRNVKYVAKYCDIVQLLFFSKDYLNEVMEDSIIDRLKQIKELNNLDYIIHLPIDFDLMNSNKNNIIDGYNIVEKIILKTKILEVKNFILHIDRFDNFTYPRIENNAYSRQIFENNLIQFKNLEKKYNVKILIENTSYDLTFYSDLLLKYDFYVCLDFGHLFLYDFNIVEFLKKFSNRILLVHIHGVSNGKEHIDINLNTSINNQHILNFLKNYNFDTIIEVFNKKDFFRSLNFIYKMEDFL